MEANGLLDWDTEKKHVQIHLMRIGLNEAFMDVKGKLDYQESPSMEFQLSCRQMPIQAALDAIPKDFIPEIYGAQVQGTMDMTFDFAVDLANPRDLTFEPQVDVHDFYVVKYAESADIRKLKGPFKHVAKKKDKVVKEFMVGPTNPDFVPYKELGHYAIRGVLTCEDGRFFRHSGFQLKHIKASLVRNLKEKRFARGGSTISMQTTKNLFLSGKKNLSRKFQEMLLTYALEHELTKERILEIYMNIIEWGPELYGIGPAASHYFGKSPAGLQPIEAAFLGSIIANPVRYHYMYSRGDVTDSWSIYLQTICSKMGIGPEAYEEAAPYRPEFGWVRKKRQAEEKKAKEEAEKMKKEKENKSQVAIPAST
jgi:membrane peptidoglycan carboxypeptidase